MSSIQERLAKFQADQAPAPVAAAGKGGAVAARASMFDQAAAPPGNAPKPFARNGSDSGSGSGSGHGSGLTAARMRKAWEKDSASSQSLASFPKLGSGAMDIDRTPQKDAEAEPRLPSVNATKSLWEKTMKEKEERDLEKERAMREVKQAARGSGSKPADGLSRERSVEVESAVGSVSLAASSGQAVRANSPETSVAAATVAAPVSAKLSIWENALKEKEKRDTYVEQLVHEVKKTSLNHSPVDKAAEPQAAPGDSTKATRTSKPTTAPDTAGSAKQPRPTPASNVRAERQRTDTEAPKKESTKLQAKSVAEAAGVAAVSSATATTAKPRKKKSTKKAVKTVTAVSADSEGASGELRTTRSVGSENQSSGTLGKVPSISSAEVKAPVSAPRRTAPVAAALQPSGSAGTVVESVDEVDVEASTEAEVADFQGHEEDSEWFEEKQARLRLAEQQLEANIGVDEVVEVLGLWGEDKQGAGRQELYNKEALDRLLMPSFDPSAGLLDDSDADLERAKREELEDQERMFRNKLPSRKDVATRIISKDGSVGSFGELMQMSGSVHEFQSTELSKKSLNDVVNGISNPNAGMTVRKSVRISDGNDGSMSIDMVGPRSQTERAATGNKAQGGTGPNKPVIRPPSHPDYAAFTEVDLKGEPGMKERPSVRDSYMRFTLDTANNGAAGSRGVSKQKAMESRGDSNVRRDRTRSRGGELLSKAFTGAKDQRERSFDDGEGDESRKRAESRARTFSRNLMGVGRKSDGSANPGKVRTFTKNVSNALTAKTDTDGLFDRRAKSGGHVPKSTWRQAVAAGQKDGTSSMMRICPVPNDRKIDFTPVGARTALDLFAFTNNGIRKDLQDLFLILHSLGSRLVDGNLKAAATFFEWWATTRVVIVEAMEMRERIVFGRLEDAGAGLMFDLSGPKRAARSSAVYKIIGAIDELELSFVGQDNDNCFVELVESACNIRDALMAEFAVCESDGAAALEQALQGSHMLALEAELYEAYFKSQHAEDMLSTCVNWIDNPGVFEVFESRHLRGMRRVRFKKMHKRYQANHVQLARNLVAPADESATPWLGMK
ncbi:hypothetical protein FVE85_1159 [Porphyridium purpureum]|uniref:Uncharacterized protein n=1 Tax=Porphyridium purpureum TaxID=35688 RepID=A0A5J4Z2B6_PORPP|nr:hypothetical protein FVE85_1159 [Porphyridium purpureum]|eukprot:POR1213..scf208_2